MPKKTLFLMISTLIGVQSFGLAVLANPIQEKPIKLAETKVANMPIVAIVKADWCAACKKIDSTVKGVMKSYMDKATWVIFDVTNKETTQSAKEKAKQMGLDTFFQKYSTQTSTVAIIHPKTKKIIKIFQAEGDKTKYIQALDQAIKSL